MYFLSLPKGESCWGQWPVTVLSLATSLGYFPVHVSLPEHPFCRQNHGKRMKRTSEPGLGSSRQHEEAPAEEGLPIGGTKHFVPLSLSLWNSSSLFILFFRPESLTAPWPLHLLEGLHDSYLISKAPEFSWSDLALSIHFPTGGLRERGKERQDT